MTKTTHILCATPVVLPVVRTVRRLGARLARAKSLPTRAAASVAASVRHSIHAHAGAVVANTDKLLRHPPRPRPTSLGTVAVLKTSPASAEAGPFNSAARPASSSGGGGGDGNNGVEGGGDDYASEAAAWAVVEYRVHSHEGEARLKHQMSTICQTWEQGRSLFHGTGRSTRVV